LVRSGHSDDAGCDGSNVGKRKAFHERATFLASLLFIDAVLPNEAKRDRFNGFRKASNWLPQACGCGILQQKARRDSAPLRLCREGRAGANHREAFFMVLDESTFEEIVSMSYESLYRFAFSLTQREADARDLTQEAFRQLANKAAQIQDKTKVKSWLFTTLYRAFIDSRRRQIRYPHVDVEAAVDELPVTAPIAPHRIDAEAARQALMKVDEVYRTPLTLFYLGEHSYLEIAEILNIPPGTVMSRISRGRAILRRLLGEGTTKVVPFEAFKAQAAS